MALNIPSGLYSEGQVTFDAMPYAKAIEAKKKAVDDAFTNYYDKLNAKLNTQGVKRNQDLINEVDGSGILKDINDWRTYGITHRKEIAKGGPERVEFENMYTNINSRIKQSNAAFDLDKRLGDLKFSGAYDPDPDDLKKQDALHYSIYDPRHYKESFIDPNYKERIGTSLTLGDFSPAVGTISIADQEAIENAAMKGIEMKPVPKGKTYTIGTTIYQPHEYSKDDLTIAAQKVMSFFPDVKTVDANGNVKYETHATTKQEKELVKTYAKLLNNADFLAQADPIFKSYFGRSIQTAGDAAAAKLIVDKMKLKKDQKVGTKERPVRPRVSRGGSHTSTKEDWMATQVARAYGVTYPNLTAGGRTGDFLVVPEDQIDAAWLNIIRGVGAGIVPLEPIKNFSWKNSDGSVTKKNVYIVDPYTFNYYGSNGKREAGAIQDFYTPPAGKDIGSKGKVTTPPSSSKASGVRLYPKK